MPRLIWLSVMGATSRMALRQMAPMLLGAPSVWAQTAVYALILSVIGRTGGALGAAVFAATGAALAMIWATTLMGGSFALWFERWEGRMPVLLASPAPFSAVLTGTLLAYVVLGCVVALPAPLVTALVVPLPAVASWPALLLALVATGVAMGGLALAVAPVMGLRQSHTDWFDALILPLSILSGLMVSIDVLPPVVQWMSRALPPYWAVTALRAAWGGPDAAAALGYALTAIVLGLCYAAIGWVLLTPLTRHMRRFAAW